MLATLDFGQIQLGSFCASLELVVGILVTADAIQKELLVELAEGIMLVKVVLIDVQHKDRLQSEMSY